eukprot:Tbor_TRINITY_DN6068_c3_g1::TRINITY_DN6068_c3_g1_i1::g.10715::m.10715
MSSLKVRLPCFFGYRNKKSPSLCHRRWNAFLVAVIIFIVAMLNIIPWMLLTVNDGLGCARMDILDEWEFKTNIIKEKIRKYINSSQIDRDLALIPPLSSLRSSHALPGVESVTTWELLAGQYLTYNSSQRGKSIDNTSNNRSSLRPYMHYIGNETDAYGVSSVKRLKVCGSVIPHKVDIWRSLLASFPSSSFSSSSSKYPKSILKKNIDRKSSAALYPPLQKLLGETHRIGVKEEYLYTGDDKSITEDSLEGSGAPARYAFVLMVSNHKYVDGALVVGESIRRYSKLVRERKADLVILVSDTIRFSAIEMLTRVFHRVKIVYTLATFSSKSYYKTTFDKIYLFWMTDYEAVILVDADSLIIGSPDFLLKEVSKTNTPLTAVGVESYFQTGLMIAKPNRDLFTDLYLEYRLGGAAKSLSKKKKGNKNPIFTKEELSTLNSYDYNNWEGRDGVLIRNCFMPHHRNINHPLSAIYHFYGWVKPWFNKDAKQPNDKNYRLKFDKRYKQWWDIYETLHHKYFVPIAIRDAAEVMKRVNDNITGKMAVRNQSDDAVKAANKYYDEYIYGHSSNFPSKSPIPGLEEAFKEARYVTKDYIFTLSFPLSLPPVLKLDRMTSLDAAVYGGPRGVYDMYLSMGRVSTSSSELLRQAQLFQRILSPRKYMWLQRFSIGNEYFRPTNKRYSEIQNYSSPYSSLTPISVGNSSGLSTSENAVTKKPTVRDSVVSVLFFPSYRTTMTKMKENTSSDGILGDGHSVLEWGPPVGGLGVGTVHPQSDGSLPSLTFPVSDNRDDAKRENNIGFVIEGGPGQSCDDACSQYSSSHVGLSGTSTYGPMYGCLEQSLTHTLVNDCFYSQWHISSPSNSAGLDSFLHSSSSTKTNPLHFGSFSEYLDTLKRTILSNSSSEKSATIESVAVAVNNILRHLRNRRCHRCVHEFDNPASPGVYETNITLDGVANVDNNTSSESENVKRHRHKKDKSREHYQEKYITSDDTNGVANTDLYRAMRLRKEINLDKKERYMSLLRELVSVYGGPLDTSGTTQNIDQFGSFREVPNEVLFLPLLTEGDTDGEEGTGHISFSTLRKCSANYLFNNESFPSCGAEKKDMKRYCVCGRV